MYSEFPSFPSFLQSYDLQILLPHHLFPSSPEYYSQVAKFIQDLVQNTTGKWFRLCASSAGVQV